MPAATSAPTFGGDTIYAWSEVLEKAAMPGRARCRGAAGSDPLPAKDLPLHRFPRKQADGKYQPGVMLELDYWLLVPRRMAA